MITDTRLYESRGFDPYENIAVEKFLLEHVQPGQCILYLWQNKNTVVIGRNQNAWAECRTTLLEQEGGKLARRLSGGGAVFHDLGNLNFTFLVREEDYDLDRQFSVIEEACRSLGIPTERSGRNDLLADGRKFSGNAFYHSQGQAYHHGTLLVDADMDKLSRYLSPSKAKLEAKGVSSVRSRVTNLKDLCPTLTCETLKAHMAQAFGRVYAIAPQPLELSGADFEEISASAAALADWQWRYGPKLPFTFACEERFSWGSICIQLQVVSGQVEMAHVYSDSMDFTLCDTVSHALTGCRFTLAAMTGALEGLPDPDVRRDLCAMLAQQQL